VETGTKGKIKRRLGDNLVRAGAFVGVIGAIAMAVKLKIELTPGMQQVLFYKGTFAAAAVLLILGAWYGRQGRIEEAEAKKMEELNAPSDVPLSERPVRTPEEIRGR
jgi:energy-converting hydrogenase Eha subunit B